MAGPFTTLQFKDADFNTIDLGGGVARLELAAPAGGLALSAGTQSVGTGTINFANSNGVTFGMSNSNQITASHNGITTQSGQAVTAQNGGFNFETLSFSNANGISFGTSAGSAITGSHNALTSQSNQAFSAQGGSSTFQTLSFNNANGFTFSNVGGAVQGSYTVPSFVNSSLTVSDNATSGTVARLAFTNLNGVTLGLSTGAGGSHTVSGSIATSLTNINISAGTTSQNLSKVTFDDAGGVSFGLNGSVITAVAPAGGGGITNINLSAGTTSLNLSKFTLANSNGVSFGLDNSTVTASIATSLTNINVSAGTTSQNLSNLVFSNSNSVTFGLSGSTITASIDAAGGGLTNINISAGTTSNNLSNVVFSNSNGVSFGLNGSTVTASVDPPTTLSFWPPQYMAPLSGFAPNSGTTGGTGASTQLTVSLRMGQLQLPCALTWKTAGILVIANTVAGTGSYTAGFFAGIYTLNGGTRFDLITNMTSQFVQVVSQNSVTARTVTQWWGTNSAANTTTNTGNNSGAFQGSRYCFMETGGGSLSAGDYFLAIGYTARTSGANVNFFSSLYGNQAPYANYSRMGGNTVNSDANIFVGNISTTTNTDSMAFPVLPATINTTCFTTANNPPINPVVLFRGAGY